jgi:hypothetical protein
LGTIPQPVLLHSILAFHGSNGSSMRSSAAEADPDLDPGLWGIYNALPRCIRAFPRLFAHTVYRARDRRLEGIESWHKYSQESFDESAIVEDGSNSFFDRLTAV